MESKPEESNPTPESTEESTANKLNSMEDPEDLDMFVQTLMDSMNTRFSRLSNTILTRMDDMGSKIDDLEKSIAELCEEVGVKPDQSLSAGGKPKP